MAVSGNTLMAATELWTFDDVVEHVCDVFDIDASTRNQRMARRAVMQAYRDLPNLNTWSYYYRHKNIQTVASYSTGTVAYDHSGGAYERMLTLTTGTFPTWAARGRIIIDDVHYDVEDWKSTTIVTLTANSNPGADVASGTTFELYRSAYPLPADFRKLAHLFNQDDSREIPIILADTQQVAEGAYYRQPSSVWAASVKNDGDYLGGLSLVLTPPPSEAVTLDMLYEARPRQLAVQNYSTGTVTSSTTTITGTSTVWDSTHIGCIIRFSADGTSVPTSLFGVRSGNLTNPFVAQRVVMNVSNATTITIDSALSAELTGVKYTISDPIDIEAGAMFTAFLRTAEMEMAQMIGRKDIPLRQQLARQSVIMAMEADQRVPNASTTIPYDPIRYASITTE